MSKPIKIDAFLNDAGCIELPEAERVLGLALFPHQTDRARSEISFQYVSARTRRECELRVPIRGALYWMNVLQTIVQYQGLQDLAREAVDP